MRLARFRLERYGPFEQLDLRLDPAPGRVNLIVAPNGYGKSVIRHAIGEFLFGIKPQTAMSFRFGTEKMRLLADVVHDTGCRSLVRRKGIGITLADAGGGDVRPDEARRLLGGADETLFRELFGLDTTLLRSGGQDLIRSQGRLGQVLFAAGGGMARVRELLTELERKRDDLGRATARHKSRPIWSALSAWEQAAGDLRKLAMRPDNWQTLEREAAETARRLDVLQAEQADDLRERDGLRTVSACRPWLDRLRAAEAALAETQDAPALDDGFEKRWRDALQQQVVTASSAAAAVVELQTARDTRAGLTFEPAWVAAEAEIAALGILSGRAEGAQTDLPEVERACAADRARIAILRRDLGLNTELPLPPAPAIKHAQQRLLLYPKLAADASAARDARAVSERALTAIRHKLDALPGLDDVAAVADRAALLRAGGDLAIRLNNSRQALRNTEAALRAALDAIPDVPLDEAALAATAAPSEGSLEAASAALLQAEAQRDQAVREQAAREAEIQNQQARLAALESSVRLPADALTTARAHRDALWAHLCAPSLEQRQPDWHSRVDKVARENNELDRADCSSQPTSGLVPPDAATAIQLDRAMRQADAIADTLIAHGQEVAQANEVRLRLQALQRAQATQAETVRQAALAVIDARAALLAIARTAGGNTGDAPALRRFLHARAKAVACRAARDAAADALRDLTADLTTLGERLATAMKVTPCTLSELGALLAEADRRTDAQRNLAAQRQSLIDQAETQRMEQAATMLRADEAERALTTWETAWRKEAAALGRPESEMPAAATEALVQIEDLRKAEASAAEKQVRIDSMRAAIDLLAARVTALQPLAPALSRMPPIEAARSFGQRLQTALQDAARCRDADQRVEQAEAKRCNAVAQAGEAARTLAGLRAALGAATLGAATLGADSNEAAERQLQRSRVAVLTRTDKAEALRQLAVQGASLSIETLVARAAATTPEADAERLQAIDARHQQRQAELEAARAAATAAAAALDQAGHGLEAAEAAQRREAAQAALARTAEEALVLHAAHTLLQTALDRQASRADQPLLARIGTVFRTITGGAQAGVRVEDSRDGQTMVALEADGITRKSLAHLSEGTSDQLYLALRVAALEDYAASTSPLPFVADDILQTFDDPRTAAALQALVSLSQQVQVIVLTHHPHVGALAACLGEAVRVISLRN